MPDFQKTRYCESREILPLSGDAAKILIVDDEPCVIDVLSEILIRQNYECRIASTSAEARIFLNDETFDLLLCDVHLPDESGIDLMKYAASIQNDLATIMITGMNDPDLIENLLHQGASDCLIKPSSINRILKCVTGALGLGVHKGDQF